MLLKKKKLHSILNTHLPQNPLKFYNQELNEIIKLNCILPNPATLKPIKRQSGGEDTQRIMNMLTNNQPKKESSASFNHTLRIGVNSESGDGQATSNIVQVPTVNTPEQRATAMAGFTEHHSHERDTHKESDPSFSKRPNNNFNNLLDPKLEMRISSLEDHYGRKGVRRQTLNSQQKLMVETKLELDSRHSDMTNEQIRILQCYTPNNNS